MAAPRAFATGAARIGGGDVSGLFRRGYLHEDLAHMAAAYAFHIAQNQPDGNKRTGLVAALVFLDLNGITVLDPQEKLYDGIIGIAERRMDKNGLAELLRELSM
ncbi:MAG TPA: type II toxin-antitoxin system death-on-curing family toxin [Pyrinomonadaceae bacterium]|nr:type II toxin-antitoxin system death-on-curing family toxin [Pyrinomonadaceae bacterium]